MKPVAILRCNINARKVWLHEKVDDSPVLLDILQFAVIPRFPDRSLKKRPKAHAVIVRPKASLRKARSAVVASKVRVPAQERSQRRFDAILDATQKLLENARIEDISFSDIAKMAGISKASVHYLFPDIAAVRAELGRRYNRDLVAQVAGLSAKLVEAGEPSWQQWLRSIADGTRRNFNSNRALSEITLGPVMSRKGRLANIETNGIVARSLLETLHAAFIVPEIQNLEMMLTFANELIDSLWSRSYVLHGHIDDETFEESMRVVVGYLRTILPETLILRAAPGLQAQRSQPQARSRAHSK